MNEMSSLTQAQRAAVIVMVMSDEEAATMLGRLEPNELQLVGETMVGLGEVCPERIANAVEGFVEQAGSPALGDHDRERQVHQRMTLALGEVKADSIMRRIAPQARPRSLELARWLAPQVLSPMLADEHPQAIAVLLLMMEAEPAAELLSLLPADIQPDLVERIARMGPVPAEAVAMLDELLSQLIGDHFGAGALSMGGPREAAELINNAIASVGALVIPAITEKDEELAKAIESEMFTFAMLSALDPLAMGRLLRDVESEVLVDALKGLKEPEREPFFAAMSARAADGVRDEIELRGRIRKQDVNAAQRTMVQAARALADTGEISFGAGDGDFV